MADSGDNGGGTTGEGEGGSAGSSGSAGNGNQGGTGDQSGSSSSAGNGNQGGEGETLEQLRERLAAAEADRDTWKKRSRQHEDRAKANADDAKAKGTLEEQLEALRGDIAKRDADAVSEKADLAAERLQAKLVRGGLSDEDAATLVASIDSTRLLTDGKPDTGEIDKLAKSLVKVSTRPAPDGDQGRKGGDAPPNMNQLIRQGAQRNTVTS